MTEKYHNKLLQGFVASDSRIIVYLKQCEETREYAVKLRVRGTAHSRVILASYSLSEVLFEFSNTIAQHSNGFTTWIALR